MKAILFAAGLGTRCWPLTLDTPKPLLRAAGKTILEHNLGQLAGLVDEARIVTGYLGDRIRQRIGAAYKGLPVTYVEQANPKGGTAEALQLAVQGIEGKLLVMNGDDFYSRGDIERCLQHDRAALGQPVPDVRRFGVFTIDGDTVSDIIEKPPTPVPGVAAVGLYVLQSDILPYVQRVQPDPAKGPERWLPDALRGYFHDHPVRFVQVQDYWLPVGYPEDLLRANRELLDREVKRYTMPQDYPNCDITGPVEIGPGTVIKPYTVIEGPVRIGRDCVIGPCTYIRPYTAIGDHCRIGEFGTLKNAILGDHTNTAHRNYVGDSVIGDHVNFADGAGAMNTRIDRKDVSVKNADGTKRETGLRKLGVIACNNIQLEGGLKLWPGTVIPSNHYVCKKGDKLVYEPLPPR